MRVEWIPSHLDRDKLPQGVSLEDYLDDRGVSLEDYLGNELADTYAKKAAERAEVPLNVSTPVLHYSALARKVQMRLVTILCALPHRPKIPKQRITEELDVAACVRDSEHVAFQAGRGRLACARCRSNFSASCSKNLIRQWLKSPCKAIGSSRDKPIPCFDTFHIGTSLVHSTHKLNRYRGLIFCSKCGSLSQGEVLGKLSKTCQPPTPYGKRNLAHIYDNRPPPGVNHWPLSDP